jgi:hypothetical protein
MSSGHEVAVTDMEGGSNAYFAIWALRFHVQQTWRVQLKKPS